MPHQKVLYKTDLKKVVHCNLDLKSGVVRCFHLVQNKQVSAWGDKNSYRYESNW